ncbi:c-type cytochrome [Flavihumibacter petaseus]|uniref:Putative cytochrome c n=1 Tax=Flavihumibacter petaseus NBRC 106054 TaxID=1220578 RepID=A0A0E9MY28_9BACT|nr:hypothetical protein [Flavihumibacter petaseus]GAO42484.1 putative cytochrome c [Flavihumibacter petaseus NBRC 106054]
MKKVLRWAALILGILLLSIVIAVAMRQHRVFEAPYPELHAIKDSAVIEKGRKLVMGPAHCGHCHASPASFPDVLAGKEVPLSGGFAFKIPLGDIYAKNLTPDPTGIGNVSDGAITRALRHGVGFKGEALLGIMPFQHMSDSDMVAILSYLRAQKPVANIVPDNKFSVPGKLVNAFLLKPVGPTEPIPVSVTPDSTAAYGKYLANSVANCRGCHTNRDLMTGAFVGEPFAGGFEMDTPTDSGTFLITTPNLTSGSGSVIQDWTLETFKARIREGARIPQSHMPWGPFSNMTDGDLTAIYRYLKTLTPVDRTVNSSLRKKE